MIMNILIVINKPLIQLYTRRKYFACIIIEMNNLTLEDLDIITRVKYNSLTTNKLLKHIIAIYDQPYNNNDGLKAASNIIFKLLAQNRDVIDHEIIVFLYSNFNHITTTNYLVDILHKNNDQIVELMSIVINFENYELLLTYIIEYFYTILDEFNTLESFLVKLHTKINIYEYNKLLCYIHKFYYDTYMSFVNRYTMILFVSNLSEHYQYIKYKDMYFTPDEILQFDIHTLSYLHEYQFLALVIDRLPEYIYNIMSEQQRMWFKKNRKDLIPKKKGCLW